MNEYSIKNFKGLIVLIDFEKAFGSLSWEFLQKSLELFNFGEKTMKWLSSLQKNSTSKVLQNGHLSKKIYFGRDAEEGNPISPYLFVLSAEFLAEAIRTSNIIEVNGRQINEEISTDYVEMALQNIRKLPIWVSSLQKNSTSKVCQNGYLSKKIYFEMTPSHPICSSYLLNFLPKPSGPIKILKG